MNTTGIAVLALAFVACASTRSGGTKPAWSAHLKGWQKIFGVAAVIMTLVILINPELYALGLLGDTAFFDMMVLALSFQMHTFVVGAFRGSINVLRRGMRWLGIPSPGLLYLLAALARMIACAGWTFRRSLPAR